MGLIHKIEVTSGNSGVVAVLSIVSSVGIKKWVLGEGLIEKGLSDDEQRGIRELIGEEELGKVLHALSGRSRISVFGGLGEKFSEGIIVEVLRPANSIVVFGAGHVGQAVALIGSIIGCDVTVVDDRDVFLTRERFPDGRIRFLCSEFEGAVEKIRFFNTSAAVIVTRGHQYDEVCLRGIVRTEAGYVGMIGSRRRVLSIFRKLRDEGVSEEDLRKVHAPIGLEIGAKSPQEIAIAIVAEIIQVWNMEVGAGMVGKG